MPPLNHGGKQAMRAHGGGLISKVVTRRSGEFGSEPTDLFL